MTASAVGWGSDSFGHEAQKKSILDTLYSLALALSQRPSGCSTRVALGLSLLLILWQEESL